jgi:glycosyltransferase involved in cell wall biosynthesis
MVHPSTAILTPVHNGAMFLSEAMASVQSQNYPNLVHFVLDNASDDATPSIVRKFEGGKVPVILFRNRMLLPMADNWNRCVELGTKSVKYFRILCADDTIPEQAIEKMVALAETDPAIVFVASSRRNATSVEDFGWDERRAVFGGLEAIRACFLNGNGLAPPHVLYRTSTIGLRQTFFDRRILSFDTEALFFLLSCDGSRMAFIHEPLGYSGGHPGSMTEMEVKPLHSDFFDWYFLIQHYGRLALTQQELALYEKAFRRHYFGKLLTWRWRHRNVKAFNWHLAELKAHGWMPSVHDYVDAVADYALRKLGFRQPWRQYPEG